jgi:hypothetical protein
MPLVPTPARLKLFHARDQCHSAQVFTPLTSWHCKFGSNTEGALIGVSDPAAKECNTIEVPTESPSVPPTSSSATVLVCAWHLTGMGYLLLVSMEF